MIFVNSSLLRPKQIRLAELFSVERILASRGFRVVSEGDGSDTFLPRSTWQPNEANLIFEIFDDPIKRSQLLSIINGHASQTIESAISNLIDITDCNLTREAFSHTFEWYVGELLVRRFGAFSSSYGVEIADILRNSDGGTSGDFDVLSILGTTDLLYIECKSGRFDSGKILNMLERARSLHVLASVMFVESLSVISLKAQLSNISYPGLRSPPKLTLAKIKGVPESEVFQWHDAFFVSAAQGAVNVEAKLKSVLRLLECKKAEITRNLVPEEQDYLEAGYEVKVL